MSTGGRLRGGLMVCGTASDVGKTQIVTGLCRLLARRGVRVAPFKAQNMSNNSFVTPSGHEIGRAQGIQALAAGAEPEVAMNPILLKPTGERGSQVILNGRPVGHLSAMEYHRRKPELLGEVLAALADLRSRYDVVLAEGAGGAAEINLLDRDIVNLRVAVEAGLPSVVVGDIDRGGVFAALYGTVELLPAPHRSTVAGFIVNKLRGDPRLLEGVGADLEARCGVPTLGVLPWIEDIALDAEDSLGLAGARPRPSPIAREAAGSAGLVALADAAGSVTGVGSGTGAGSAGLVALDIAVVRLPRISNFTDLDPLGLEPSAGVRMVDHAGALGQPDLIVLPGSKSTVADLDWLRGTGLAAAVLARHRQGAVILGVCGGYQMLGRRILDPGHTESDRSEVEGLGLLDVETVFGPGKVTLSRTGAWPAAGVGLTGYQIHHGRVQPAAAGIGPWLRLDDRWGAQDEGVTSADGTVMGTTLHGLFEHDAFRAAFLGHLARLRGGAAPGSPARPDGPANSGSPAPSGGQTPSAAGGISYAAARLAQWDRLADALEEHLDIARLERIIESASPAPAAGGGE